jgi:large subunit ribosomal protein L18
MSTTKVARRQRIRQGIRNKVTGTAECPRLSIFKSNKAIYAQIIDDAKGATITATSSIELGIKSNTVEHSKNVGAKLAEKAKAAGIETVVFDRGGYQYHGQVKALAEGAREGGLKF